MTAPLVVLLAVCAAAAVDVVWLMHRAHRRDDELLLAKMRELCETSKSMQVSLALLDFIAEQFSTNEGHTMRDVVDRLEDAAGVSQQSAEMLKVQTDIARELASHDRERMDRLALLIGYLDEHVAEGAATGIRIEEAAGVAADDLAERYQRADDTIGPSGAAADAAAQSAPPEDPE